MSSDPFRIALVGTGKVGGSQHLPAALATDGVRVTALVDPSLDRARQVAERFRIPARLSSQVTDVLGDVDGVVIATPNNTHAEIAGECLRAGVHTLIEKPMATTLAEAETIVQAAEASGSILAVGFCTRFLDNVSLMKELLDIDYFGQVHRFIYQFGTAGGWAPFSGYNLDRRSAGGGVLIGTGSHFLDRMLWWFGYPEEVEYADDSLGGPEANCVATFRYRRGGAPFEGQTRFSKAVALSPGFVMETDRGTVLLREGPEAPIILRPRDAPSLETTLHRRRAILPESQGPFERQMQDFVDACRTGGKPLVSSREGLESMRLIDALYAKRTTIDENWYVGSDVAESS